MKDTMLLTPSLFFVAASLLFTQSLTATLPIPSLPPSVNASSPFPDTSALSSNYKILLCNIKSSAEFPFKPLSDPSYCELTFSEIRHSLEDVLPPSQPRYWGPPPTPFAPSTYHWQPHGSRGCRVVLKPQTWNDVGFFSVQDLENVLRIILLTCQGPEVGATGPWGYGAIASTGRDGIGPLGRDHRVKPWMVYVFNATTFHGRDFDEDTDSSHGGRDTLGSWPSSNTS